MTGPHEEYEAAQAYDEASGCPSSASGHPIRRGSSTQFLPNDMPEPVVSHRTDASSDVLDAHYDQRREEEKMEQRRELLASSKPANGDRFGARIHHSASKPWRPVTSTTVRFSSTVSVIESPSISKVKSASKGSVERISSSYSQPQSHGSESGLMP